MDGCSPTIDISDDCGNKVAHDSRVARLSKGANAPREIYGLKTINSVGPNNYFSMLRSLHEYAPLPAMRDYSEADHETKRQIAALITVTSDMYYEYVKSWNDDSDGKPTYNSRLANLPISMGGGIRINDNRLMRLVMELPDKAESIATIIIDDEIADACLLRERVLSSSQSLRQGIL